MKIEFSTARLAGFSRRTAVSVLLFGGLLFFAGAAVLPEPPPAPRVVAIGDVHGDFDNFLSLLQHNALVDSNLKWTGGGSTLVQTGDVLDRGKKCRTVLDLLMALEKEAPKKRGRVIALLGNHEMMNITGDLRYAEPMFASFTDSKSESRRQKAWGEYVTWRKNRAGFMKQPEPFLSPEDQADWMKAHPLGFFEQREAMGPSGKYGRWLRERPAVVRVGDTIFVHGGISPEIAEMQPEAIEQRIRSEIRAWDSLVQFLVEQKVVLPFFTLSEMTSAVQETLAFQQQSIAQKQAAAAQEGKTYQPDAAEKQLSEVLQQFLGYPGWFSINPAGPLWYRGFAQWSDEEGDPQVTKMLAAYKASRFVVGHTPTRDGRIAKRFTGKVFLIDTGMLSTYFPGGRASALEIAQNAISAVYMDSRVVLHESAAAAQSVPASGEDLLLEIPGGGVQERTSQVPTPLPPQHANPEPAAHSGSSPRPAHVWTGPDGKALPIQSDEEIMEFLRTAKVLSVKGIGVGINQIQRLEMEKDDVRMRAAFRDHEEEKDIAKMASGQIEMGFRDSYLFEPAAYELAGILGLDNVPPVVVRSYASRKGSIQIWLENAMMETDRQKKKIRPPDAKRWNQQVQILRLFDNLIYNTDRNMGNILIDADWKLWMIDHTRAFRRHDSLNNPNAIVQVERRLWDRLRNFDETDARQRLKPYLRGTEIDALFKRRLKIIDHINKMIQQRGEADVIFDLK